MAVKSIRHWQAPRPTRGVAREAVQGAQVLAVRGSIPVPVESEGILAPKVANYLPHGLNSQALTFSASELVPFFNSLRQTAISTDSESTWVMAPMRRSGSLIWEPSIPQQGSMVSSLEDGTKLGRLSVSKPGWSTRRLSLMASNLEDGTIPSRSPDCRAGCSTLQLLFPDSNLEG